MPTAIFQFQNELNDFLPKDKRRVEIDVAFHGHESVKHLIESWGVPHTEVDVIMVNRVSVDFATHLKDGDRVEIYPVSGSFEMIPIIHLIPEWDFEPRFILDGHLGKLTSYLRFLGFDSLYCNNLEDDELAEISSCDNRILLTRDRGLLKRNQVRYGYCVRSKNPQKQIVEIMQRFDLVDQILSFSRCCRCNGLLLPVAKEDILNFLEPKTQLYYDEFRICQECEKIYWKGSHYEHMVSNLKTLIWYSKR